MSDQLHKRVPENAPGDFYVEAGACLRCCMPHSVAPDLMNDAEHEFDECFFRRQPQTMEEIDQACEAIEVSDVCGLRYGGTDPRILWLLHERNCDNCCDHPLEIR